MVSNELGNPQTESKDKLDRAGPASLVMLDPINTLKGPISGSAGAWGAAWVGVGVGAVVGGVWGGGVASDAGEARGKRECGWNDPK